MQIIFVIIIVVIVSLLSALGKKKPNKSTENEPPRPTLSDIQRAFMMSGEMASPKRAPEAQQIPSYSTPPAQTPRPAATPRVAESVFASQAARPRAADAVSAYQAPSRYANIDLAAFHVTNDDVSAPPKKVVRHQTSSLKLFEDKNDFVRAVIYSEILTRKAHR